jgi:hypothetical protein
VAADRIAVLDIVRERAPQRVEFPGGLLALECRQSVAKGTFQLAIGWRVMGRGMEKLAPQIRTAGLE